MIRIMKRGNWEGEIENKSEEGDKVVGRVLMRKVKGQKWEN